MVRMKGSDKVIDLLNEVLTAELTAINQYWIHARMCHNWGYHRLWEKIRHESIDEMKHADELVERILYFDGVPNLQRLGKVNVGQTVTEIFKLDLAMEKEALERFNRGVALCVAEGDNGTREILEKMLRSEEEHVDWLETQLHLIEKLGEAHYLSQQLHG
jgi:bacterioferritin